MAFEKNNQSKDLFSSQVDIQTKRFFFDLKENHKGRYLRITEQSGGRSSIVVPVEGLDEFENQIKIAISKSQD
ncbi:DNA-binding protein [bacterium]|nr:DNA-binding protein [bacterium]|tara:strand:+ start:1502 stop:1720 length:219 start_codon:yes stop_codon:yes gene_type:complete